MITIFDKLFYFTLVMNELTTEYGMSKREAISAINSSTLKKTLKLYLEIQLHDSVESTARMVYRQSIGLKY